MSPFNTGDDPVKKALQEYVHPKLVDPNIRALAVGGKKVVINFNGGSLSSDAGALPLREVEEQIHLIRKRAEVIPDARDAPRYYAFHDGYADSACGPNRLWLRRR